MYGQKNIKLHLYVSHLIEMSESCILLFRYKYVF